MKRILAVFALSLAFFTVAAADRPIITNIQTAVGKGRKINVTWTLPEKCDPPINQLLVFRDKRTVSTYAELASLSPVAQLNATYTGWTDTVSDYNDYFYTVICVTANGRYDIILPSINATVNGIHLKIPEKKASPDTSASAKEKLYPAGTMRETPLPYLDLIEGTNGKQVTMSRQAKDQAKLLAGIAKKTQKPLDPYVFEDDLVSPDGGDDFLLFETLRTTFIQKKYTEACTQLEKLLGTNRSENVINRATFYLGQSLYFTGNYKNAVRRFLTVSDKYPALCQKWIDSSLDYMVVPKK